MGEMEVPPHFACPISLQMMRDPVTISSGITYDRESIEKWLSSCAKRHVVVLRCPVTKQALRDGADVTPNHTLRRLIQGWCTVNGVEVERIVPTTPKAEVDRGHTVVKLLKEAVNVKSSPLVRLQCLQRLNAVVVESERNKVYFQDAKCLELLASMLNINNNSDDKAIREEAIQLISITNYSYSDTLLKQLLIKNSDIIDCSIDIAKTGSPNSRASAISFLSSIYTTAADQTHKTFTKDDVFMEVTRAIKDQIATKPALQILLQLAPWGRNRVKAVKNGAVFHLVELLLNSTAGRECELAMAALDRLCECAEGRAELLRHGGGLAAVGRKILRVSHLANEKAVRILKSVCKKKVCGNGMNCGVGEEMVEVGVMGKLALVLQVGVGVSLKTKDTVKEILQSHQCVYFKCLVFPSGYHL